jgi:hypothetical protein
MDNIKVMEVMEKFTLQKYLEKLIDAPMHKITLFTAFPYTGAANLSDPASLVIIDDVARIVSLNGGAVNN